MLRRLWLRLAGWVRPDPGKPEGMTADHAEAMRRWGRGATTGQAGYPRTGQGTTVRVVPPRRYQDPDDGAT